MDLSFYKIEADMQCSAGNKNTCIVIILSCFYLLLLFTVTLLCIIMIVVSTSRYWWIGGEKISDNWYWRGITTRRIPENGSADSGWHLGGHNESSETSCIYYKTAGSADGSHNGWDSHSACSVNMYFICERRL